MTLNFKFSLWQTKCSLVNNYQHRSISQLIITIQHHHSASPFRITIQNHYSPFSYFVSRFSGTLNDGQTMQVRKLCDSQQCLRPTTHNTYYTSHLTPHTSHLTPHTSHLTPHTPHTSHLTPHTSAVKLTLIAVLMAVTMSMERIFLFKANATSVLCLKSSLLT
jgi:hypothetical protein